MAKKVTTYYHDTNTVKMRKISIKGIVFEFRILSNGQTTLFMPIPKVFWFPLNMVYQIIKQLGYYYTGLLWKVHNFTEKRLFICGHGSAIKKEDCNHCKEMKIRKLRYQHDNVWLLEK